MNWKSLIIEIQATGMSQVEIAESVGRSQAWVSATILGVYKDIRWADGQALIQLHAERCQSAKVAA